MRVIAGMARGRPLKAPKVTTTRPTTDRVKEALFSILEAEAYKRGFEPTVEPDGTVIFGSARAWPVVLDLYAGSGALGIEALSRGAQRVDFVESNSEARRVLADNLFTTGLEERAHIYPLPAEVAVVTLPGPYDLIFLDPPYGDPRFPQVFERLANSRLIGPNTVVVLEHSRAFAAPKKAGKLRLRTTRYYGGTAVSIYEPEKD